MGVFGTMHKAFGWSLPTRPPETGSISGRYPANREINREFRHFRPVRDNSVQNSAVFQVLGLNSLSAVTGNFQVRISEAH